MISRYFKPLEDEKSAWDQEKIDAMILYHDIDEIETGDTIGYLKTTEHKSIEIDATKRVVAQLPTSLQKEISDVVFEYFAQESPEARFVRAVDKLEPVFHLFCDNGRAINLHNSATYEQHMGLKRPALIGFPIMERFNEVCGEHMHNNGFFTTPRSKD